MFAEAKGLVPSSPHISHYYEGNKSSVEIIADVTFPICLMYVNKIVPSLYSSKAAQPHAQPSTEAPL